MKLTVLQENFSRALSNTSRFASTRSQLPVLANILLSSSKTKLLVASTNLEVSLAISIGAQVQDQGEITVPARVITELISHLPAGPVNLEVEKEVLKIKAADFTSTVSGMNAADFPTIPSKLENKKVLELPYEDFILALSQVSFSTSVDETRPILTGILFIFKKGALSLVSTDGFRLSQKKLQVKTEMSEERIILPKNALSEISRLTSEKENLFFSYQPKERQVSFGVDNSILSSRILEGEFPDFEKIIPKDSSVTIHLDREDFLRAIKLASVFAREAANLVKIQINKDNIEILAESSQSGGGKTKVEASVEGKGFEIAFNYKFLEDFLQAVTGDEIKIEMTSPSSPAVFTDPKDSTFLHLIMPVRLQD
jgi:DNA polymerase-3 subunit beta